MIEKLIERGVTVHILNLGVMDNTPTGKLIRTVMLGFAEFERDMIVQRTQEGKEIAHAKGVRVDGRPKLQLDKAKVKKFRELQKGGKMSVTECCKELGVSRSYWYKAIAI